MPCWSDPLRSARGRCTESPSEWKTGDTLLDETKGASDRSSTKRFYATPRPKLTKRRHGPQVALSLLRTVGIGLLVMPLA